jgi:hypothetical protein
VLLPAIVAICGSPVGCQQRDKPKVIFLEGVVEKVDPVRKFAVVRFLSEKHGSEQTEAVLVTAETEILIDGALASLADVVVGEHAQGYVRETNYFEQTVYTALRVRISRTP